jgi:hypothetical protein
MNGNPATPARSRLPALAGALAFALLVVACGSKQATPPAAATDTAAPATPATPEAAPAAAAVPAPAVTQASWAPDEIEKLVSPIALYPDQLVGQILAASVNPQEVLDGATGCCRTRISRATRWTRRRRRSDWARRCAPSCSSPRSST